MTRNHSLPLPPVVRIEPASACNLKCTHCPTGVVKQTRGIMKPHTFERVLSELKPHVPPVRVAVLYHGGEPFLNKNFLEMVRRVKALGIPLVKTISNGMLVQPEMCSEIVNSGLDAIEISLDAESPRENDMVRVGWRRPGCGRCCRVATRVPSGIRVLIASRHAGRDQRFRPPTRLRTVATATAPGLLHSR